MNIKDSRVMRKTKFILYSLIGTMMVMIAALFSGCEGRVSDNTYNEAPIVTGNFDFTVLKMGKADGIILQTENHTVIIDCGEKGDGDKIVKYLSENNISIVDYVFITHFDKDHVGGFPTVVNECTVNNVMVPDYEGSNSEYKKYLQALEDNNLKACMLTDDTAVMLDDVLFEISVPKKKSYKEGDNDFSLVISVTHGENSFLFAGDAEEERLTEVLSEITHEYDFLKVPHHGRYNNATKRFLSVVKPRYAVICDSDKNPAEEETLAALTEVESKVYSTKDGNISVSSDGRTLNVTQ